MTTGNGEENKITKKIRSFGSFFSASIWWYGIHPVSFKSTNNHIMFTRVFSKVFTFFLAMSEMLNNLILKPETREKNWQKKNTKQWQGTYDLFRTQTALLSCSMKCEVLTMSWHYVRYRLTWWWWWFWVFLHFSPPPPFVISGNIPFIMKCRFLIFFISVPRCMHSTFTYVSNWDALEKKRI